MYSNVPTNEAKVPRRSLGGRRIDGQVRGDVRCQNVHPVIFQDLIKVLKISVLKPPLCVLFGKSPAFVRFVEVVWRIRWVGKGAGGSRRPYHHLIPSLGTLHLQHQVGVRVQQNYHDPSLGDWRKEKGGWWGPDRRRAKLWCIPLDCEFSARIIINYFHAFGPFASTAW